MYFSLILRDFAFTEHYFFFDRIAILRKLSATIWFKLLESAYIITAYLDSSSFHKIVGSEIPAQFERQNNNPRRTSKFGPLQRFPNLTEKRNNSR